MYDLYKLNNLYKDINIILIMFNIITVQPANNYLYNNYRCLYYSILPFNIILFGIGALCLTVYNLPSAMYNILKDKEYNNNCTRIIDIILSFCVGFSYLYYIYFTAFLILV
jgi:hypothetical protein